MIDLLLDVAKFIVRMRTPTYYDFLVREKELLREFNERMKKEKGEGWSINSLDGGIQEIRGIQKIQDIREIQDVPKKNPVDYISEAMRILKKARDEATCPVVRDTIDEMILTMEERLSKRISVIGGSKLLEEIKKVIEEEGIDDWDDLSEERKAEVIKKVKSRLGG